MTIDGAFRARVLAREFLAGFWLNLGSPVTAEMAGLAGFDWVMLDHEHGPGSESTMLHQLQAVSATPATCLVRVAANEPPRFKRALDAGAHGVMVPYVSTPAEARAAVQAMRYPPRGVRGVAKLTRASAFGARFDEYFAHAHEWLVTLVQIETEEAVRNVAEIAAVDGVDVVFVGPMDLTTSMGIAGQYDNPRFHEALGVVADAADRAGKAAGILLLDPANVMLVRTLGYSVVALGSDGGAVMTGIRESLGRLSGEVVKW
jgi:2-keto-3-deoxy-L-rhamnonate aldolase RhmA